jgi:hypothetical protein
MTEHEPVDRLTFHWPNVSRSLHLEEAKLLAETLARDEDETAQSLSRRVVDALKLRTDQTLEVNEDERGALRRVLDETGLHERGEGLGGLWQTLKSMTLSEPGDSDQA